MAKNDVAGEDRIDDEFDAPLLWTFDKWGMVRMPRDNFLAFCACAPAAQIGRSNIRQLCTTARLMRRTALANRNSGRGKMPHELPCHP
jgi:hypothetical protein